MTDVSYLQKGRGKDLLFLHGYLSSKEAFTAQISYFSRFYRVTALDFLGFGKSGKLVEPFSVADYAEWTAKVLKELKIEKPHVIAHSFGCRVAVKMAEGRGQVFDKILLTGPAGVILKRGLGYKIKVKTYRLVKRFAPNYAERKFGSVEYRTLTPLMKESYKKIVNEDLRGAASRVENEVLIVEGMKDTITPKREAEAYLAAFPNAKLKFIDGGHFAFAENPLAFNLLAEEFFFMIEIGIKIATCIAFTCFFHIATFKSLGIMQQCGYHNNAFMRWLKRKDNLFFNRLSIWSLSMFFSVPLASLAFSPLGVEVGVSVGLMVYLMFSFLFCWADRKYALKVPVNVTNRLKRLSVGYIFITACATYILISLMSFVADLFNNELYYLFQFLLLTLTPMALPFFLLFANKLLSPLEKANNRRHVERARQVLDKSNAVRIGIVGSYGKTSVKNILHSILSVKYSVISTPESYNTPAGVAKTVNCLNVPETEIFIAEMGARRMGDVAELCELVKPDYAIFVGVCAQHMETFKTEENLIKAKCEIIKGVKNTVVCGEKLKEKITGLREDVLSEADKKKCVYACGAIENLVLEKDSTSFTLCLASGEKLQVQTAMLGSAAAENIALAVLLAEKLGLTKDEILQGVEKIRPVPHRLNLIETDGVYILDDAYNCSEQSAREAIAALQRFENKKIVVTPGIIEGGILEEKINGELGETLAKATLDEVILVGETLIGAVKKGYLSAGGDENKLKIVPTLEKAKALLSESLGEGDAVLFLNDLPDAY